MNYERLIPPALLWRLTRKSREATEAESFRKLYSSFLSPGDLCFDIGANLGNRIRGFRQIGCKVIALEPQSLCHARLVTSFGTDPHVILRNEAAGAEEGILEIMIAQNHVLSSLSPEFIRKTTESGRFRGMNWDRKESCKVTTLDSLIATYGMPRFVKIDVEGYEPEVLAGLNSAVPALSLEWTPELSENALRCISRLSSLGSYEFNLSWGESMKFSREIWRSEQSIGNLIQEVAGETHLFGDIYARLKQP